MGRVKGYNLGELISVCCSIQLRQHMGPAYGSPGDCIVFLIASFKIITNPIWIHIIFTFEPFICRFNNENDLTVVSMPCSYFINS